MKSLVLTAFVVGSAGIVAAQQPLLVPAPLPTPVTPQRVAPPAAVEVVPHRAFEPIPSTPALIPDPSQGQVVPYEQIFVPQPEQVVGPALPLYENVRVRQTRNMHPRAVPTLVAIRNPSFGGSCVYVEVCVPPCTPGQVLCYRRGDRIRLDYGKYSVDIVTTRRGVVVVDYND